MMYLFLVGFMGSGKSTVGRLLADATGCPFLDTDEMIVRRTGHTIPWIFAHRGEGGFREMETDLLREMGNEAFKSEGRRTVVAAGGGMVCREENLRLMKEQGILVYLRAPFDDLMGRIGREEGRPLAGGLSRGEMRELFRKREPLYLRADHTVDNGSDTPPLRTARRIVALLTGERGWTACTR
jgi:shikimate kinase